MEQGLDQLIEALLSEIAFSGVRGCAITTLLSAIDSFYNGTKGNEDHSPPEPNSEGEGVPQGQPGDQIIQASRNEDYDLGVASQVWLWLVARDDVSVGDERKFNHLSLEETLAMPEEKVQDAQQEGDETNGQSQSQPSRASHDRGSDAHRVRPRLRVSEERQWQTIAGHAPDLKRVPLFEWKALADIASVKEKGILQGDLVRLTGQDKRSLPTRTDALAKKGYIIKQPVLIRGCRSSKLWLAQFSANAQEDADSEGLQFDQVDLSKEALTKDLEPVPFCSKWTGPKLDYLAIAQAFMAVVKAWGLIRYCDARAKMGVENQVAQMRGLAKTSRWLTSIGAVTFVAARFQGNSKLFKDCVKYIRDPTPAEWVDFRSTPKASIMIASGRIGKRGDASRAVQEAKGRKQVAKSHQKRPPVKKQLALDVFDDLPKPPIWTIQKPMANTVFDIIKRAGPEGTSNKEISSETLGSSYSKYTSGLTAAISQADTQPLHLKRFEVRSQLQRVGKTNTYKFVAVTERLPGDPHMEDPGVNQSQPIEQQASNGTNRFSQHDQAEFGSEPNITLSQLSQITSKAKTNGSLSRKATSGRKRKRISDDMSHLNHDHLLPSSTKRRGRPPKDVKSSILRTGMLESDRVLDKVANGPQTDASILPREEGAASASAQEEQRPPGVYYGVANSLDPPGRKGRPRKSLVIIIRHDKLKDSLFSSIAQGRFQAIHDEGEFSPVTRENPSIETVNTASVRNGIHLSKRSRASTGKKFKCSNCGNSWKNSNGLEYHLTKSQNPCNPDFVPPSPKPVHPRKIPKVVHTQHPSVEITTNHMPSVPAQPDFALRSGTNTGAYEATMNGKFSGETSVAGPHQGVVLLPNLVPHDTADIRHCGKNSIPADVEVGNVVRQLSTNSKGLGSHCKKSAQSQNSVQVAKGEPSTEKPTGTSVSVCNDLLGESGEDTGPDPNALGKLDVPAPPRDIITAKENEDLETTAEKALTDSVTTKEDPRVETNKAQAQITSNSISPRTPVSDHGTPTAPQNISQPPSATIIDERKSENELSRQRKALPLSKEERDRNGQCTEIAPESTPSTPASHAKLTKSTPSKATHVLLRDRVAQVIERLLDQNDGVFPGKDSLVPVLRSIWAVEFSDIRPPEARTCQTALNQLEKGDRVRQLHFYFKDDKNKVRDCTVIAKVQPNGSRYEDLLWDPKVVAIKDKIREMFPTPYIPANFTPSQQEPHLINTVAPNCEDVAQQPKEVLKGLPTDAPKPIETLQYPMPVLVDENDNSQDLKRTASNSTDHLDLPPAKKARIAFDKNMTSCAPNERKGRGFRHRENNGYHNKFLQQSKRAYLQDSVTGAWLRESTVTRGLRKDTDTTINGAGGDYELLEDQQRSRMGYSSDDGGTESDDTSGSEDAGDCFKSHEPSAFVSPRVEYSESEDDDDDVEMEGYVQRSAADCNEGIDSTGVRFADIQILDETAQGQWTHLPQAFWEDKPASYTIAGTFPTSRWYLIENLPQSVEDIHQPVRGRNPFKNYVDTQYGKFSNQVATIRRWEQSAEGKSMLSSLQSANLYHFLSLKPDVSRESMKPVALEWPIETQYTVENLPDEIMNASRDDEDFGVELKEDRQRNRVYRILPSDVPTTVEKKLPKTKHSKPIQRFKLPDPTPQPKAGINYKSRELSTVPRQPKGRFNKGRSLGEKMGVNREIELLTAFIVVRTLLGGVDRSIDMGLLLRLFPEISLSALKKCWPKFCRERRSYVDALTDKFQSAFLEAYAKGEVPTLNYDDIENYDWRFLIAWAIKLETHKHVELPGTREDLFESHSLEQPHDETLDWREHWFNQVAVFSRLEATASEAISVALPAHRDEAGLLSRARTWVRSLCCTTFRGVNIREKVVPKLIQLAGGTKTEANHLMETVIQSLNAEKIIVRSKGKDYGSNYRLHQIFVKQLEKHSQTSKFTQATAFKGQLDQSFRENSEFILPYASDDGAIMAVLNLQASGRIHVYDVDRPDIPFGFEPGNYEGRLFPKSYYHFKTRLVPTDTYMFDDDMPILQRSEELEVPSQGPDEEMPIWTDFFGHVDQTRWIEYLCMLAFALATKGPLTPKSAALLLRPIIDEFEVKLILGWMDRLGLLLKVDGGEGATVDEWWWLVIGKMIDMKGKRPTESGFAM
ncbi:hypothetical protein F5Y15DRAFT_254328 [Xylariaceae sp. FL0016]|nr:hypothetical protein F5Y15DRAFT_254328 [Xylariaceae sp. FL0016]